MMRAVVLSDTHIPSRAKELPAKLWEEIERADMVIHCGDFVSYDFYLELKARNPSLRAVWGNMDEPDLVNVLPEVDIFQLEDLKVGLYHGYGAPLGIEKKVLGKFQGHELDLVIFGHTHRAVFKEYEGVKLLNPGSPTDRIFTPKRSYALIEVNGRDLKVDIIYL